MQGYPENFESSCPRPRDDLRWLDEKTRYSAFSEGWGLYAEYPLVPEFTDAYENKPLSRYGMLKGQVRRFELVHVFATCAVISNQVSSTLMQFLFSFDRGMRVEKTLMQTLASHSHRLSCNSCSRLTGAQGLRKLSCKLSLLNSRATLYRRLCQNETAYGIHNDRV